MATYAEIASKGACGASDVYGTNLDNGCIIDFERIIAKWKVSPSVRISPTDDVTDSAYWIDLIVRGLMVPLTGILSFTEDGSEDSIETLEDDTQRLTLRGKYRFLETYTKGVYWQRALGAFNGFGGWKDIWIDDSGRIILYEDDNGFGQGFTVGMNERLKMTIPGVSQSLKQMARVQYLNRYEIDDSMKVLDRKNLNFDPRQIKGVTEVRLSYVNAPSNGDTALVVRAVLAQDIKTPVQDLEAADFAHFVGTTPNNPAGETESDGEYNLSILTALNSVDSTTIQIYDNANNRPIVNKNGNLYKSAIVTATVI